MSIVRGNMAGFLLLAAMAASGCAGTVHGTAQATPSPEEREAQAQSEFTPTPGDPDPSTRIDGVLIVEDLSKAHVLPGQRVAYEHSPPLGGPHDTIWAACDGVVYPQAVRSESVVHSLEHGAVWIAYNPELLSESGIEFLEGRVRGRPYTVMTPYPGLDKPISLQTWGHQLKVDHPDDVRIYQFIAALRQNPYTTPEPNATCGAVPEFFDKDDPPAFDPSPVGADGVPMDAN